MVQNIKEPLLKNHDISLHPAIDLDWLPSLLNILPLVAATGIYVSYSLGFEAVLRMLQAELFPTDVRLVMLQTQI